MKQQKARFWIDADGNRQPERRGGVDRRTLQGSVPQEIRERRKLFRRKMDRELYERDHKVMIEDALNDFAEEHGGHL